MPQSRKKLWSIWFKRKSDLKARSRFFLFLICVAFSVFLWFLNKLSDNYKTTINYPVRYINLPNNKIYTNILPAHISVEIDAKGYTLLQHQFSAENDTLIIDYASEHGLLSKNKDIHYISLKNRIDELRNQLKNTGNILSISPDTVFFNFADKEVKRVKVKLNATLNFKKQYQIKDSIIISPAFIEIYGPSENIIDVEEIETEEIVLTDISENQELNLTLKIPPSIPAYFRFSQKEVNVKIPVERYTETSITVNIQPINVPEGFEVVLIPYKAEITFLVPFSKYNLVKQQEWKLQVDFESNNQKNRLPLKLNSYPTFARIREIKPNEVEYILIKKNK
ncbi:MAG: CdaR family protein [Bacteroidia bacterium]